MALTVTNNGDLINVGTQSSLDDLDASTIMMWFLPASIPNGGRAWSKGAVAGSLQTLRTVGTTDFRVDYGRATTSAAAQSPATNFAAWSLNEPMCLVGQVDTTTTANNKLLIGSLNAPIAEPSSYGTQQAGSGAHTSNAGDQANLLNRTTGSTQWTGGPVFWMGIWRRLWSLHDLRQIQYHPMDFKSSAAGWWRLGANGTGLVIDESGHDSHGVITGALVNSARMTRIFSRRAA